MQRTIRSEEEKAALIARFEQSGLRAREFCREQGIACMRDVFERLPLIDPTDEAALEELRPSVWAAAFKAQREHSSPPALKTA